ncbi:MAG TPA: VWA domain-containing protein [Terracidiphilus sp.]|nr:VWA domain-containing protein [Terracidiphilus sp.]
MMRARSKTRENGIAYLAIACLVLLAFAAAVLGHAQYQNQQPAAQQQPDQQAPAAGGPSGDNGPIALPKKPDNSDNTPPPAPAEPKFKNPENAPSMSLRVEVPEVTVDVGVILEKTHQFVPGLKPSNFRVYEDGVEQKVEGFKRTEAPITVLILMEYAARGFFFRVDALNSAVAFTEQLRPQDYAAMMTFDLNTHIVSDFTQDKRQIMEGINELANGVYMPAAFSETDLFDALNEALDRMSRVEGEKYILLVASGVDTMSKLDLDQILKRVKESHDITIFTISTGGFIETMRGESIAYLQGENQMRTFSSLTGGMHFEPRFAGELPDDMKAINENIRAKYELVYHPTNVKQDGTWRKIRVELVDDEGQPLRMQDEKHKPLKYDIVARDGYRARQEVE